MEVPAPLGFSFFFLNKLYYQWKIRDSNDLNGGALGIRLNYGEEENRFKLCNDRGSNKNRAFVDFGGRSRIYG